MSLNDSHKTFIRLIFFLTLLISTISCRKDKFSIIILPDTQNYCNTINAWVFFNQMSYIVKMKNELNKDIKYIVHMGDLTDKNEDYEWNIVSKGFEILESANIPYSLVQGNHDVNITDDDPHEERNSLKLNQYFKVQRFKDALWWEGGFRFDDRIDNYFCLFEWRHKVGISLPLNYNINHGKITRIIKEPLFYKYIIINLEFAPSYETLDWVNSLLNKYSDRKAIIITHAYLNEGSGYEDNRSSYNIENANQFTNGQEMWDYCFSKHTNIILILCGHAFDAYQRKKIAKIILNNKDTVYNTVYEVLTDYQKEPLGGNGSMRELIFLPTKNQIVLKPISTIQSVKKFYYHQDWIDEPVCGYPTNPFEMGSDNPENQNNFHTDVLYYP